MTLLKIDRRYLNSDHIQDVIFTSDGRATITLMALTDKQGYESEVMASVAQEIVLTGRDAMALKWWLDSNSRDLIAAYSNALFAAREGVIE